MTKSARTPVAPQRRAALAKVAIGRKTLGWDDDTYRDTLEARYGVRSGSQLTDRQLVDLLEHMKACGFKGEAARPKRAGTRRPAENPEGRKIRALWLSLWNLGVVQEPSEDALASFVRRQTKVEALQWLTPAQTWQVIEALKKWAARDGVLWDDAVNPAKCVALAQVRKLKLRGRFVGLDLAAVAYQLIGVPGLAFMGTDEWNRLVGELGKLVRAQP
ncbi:regulatory protein GemA [Caenispirillum bisanense]|uniref:Mu-like prophage protein gp16 n=1 Tax=Caenispirillum bisanense TaxID=414052 RepID=A0A286GYT4_9PROT|nr:regulatory protein GemA [Caenispirillum bisanense]SOE00641.1 Mu-like prophage protein gp16 [Caenispirillum bisanense]